MIFALSVTLKNSFHNLKLNPTNKTKADFSVIIVHLAIRQIRSRKICQITIYWIRSKPIAENVLNAHTSPMRS